MADTTETLLKKLHEQYDFGPAMNARLKKALAVPVIDPMQKLPAFLQRTYPRVDERDTRTIIQLGEVDEHRALLIHYKKPYDNCKAGDTKFMLGCQRKFSKDKALAHWPGGISIHSGRHRPSVLELIEWIDRLCKFRGWKW